MECFIQRQENLVHRIFYFVYSFLQIYLSWNLFTFEIRYEIFCCCLVYSSWSYYFFLSWFLFMYFNDIHLSREFGSKYIFKSKIKKSWIVISIFLKNLFYSNTLRILILLNVEIIYTQHRNIFIPQMCCVFF